MTGIIGTIIWGISLFRLKKLGKIINADINLKNALNDEFVMHNRSKALIVGYVTLMISVGILLALSIFMDISPKLICEILLYLGVLSVLIAALVYNRN